MLVRPCLLVVDREFAGSISSRKLVLETAKFNVITAYSYEEGLATLELFPHLHGVVVTADRSHEAEGFLHVVRGRYPEIKRILTGELPDGTVSDVHVESFAPEKLLAAIRGLFPAPSAELQTREIDLAKQIDQL